MGLGWAEEQGKHSFPSQDADELPQGAVYEEEDQQPDLNDAQ